MHGCAPTSHGPDQLHSQGTQSRRWARDSTGPVPAGVLVASVQAVQHIVGDNSWALHMAGSAEGNSRGNPLRLEVALAATLAKSEADEAAVVLGAPG